MQCGKSQINIGSAFKRREDPDGRWFPQTQQCKNHSGDKLAADISSECVSSALQFPANGNGTVASSEQESLLVAEIFIDIHGPFQKPLTAPEGNRLSQTKRQRQKEPQGAAAFPTFQNRMFCLHKAAGVDGNTVCICCDVRSQGFQTVNACQNILAVIDTGQGADFFG